MKYAKEVIELLAANPNRKFKMANILNYTSKGIKYTGKTKAAMRKGIYRVLEQLIDSGQVMRHGTNTRAVMYSWTNEVLGHEVKHKSCNLGRCMRQ